MNFCDRNYNNLALAVRTRNTKLLESARSGLSLYGRHPNDVGYTSACIHGHYDRVTDKLMYASRNLRKADNDLRKLNREQSRSVMQQRAHLSCLVRDIAEDVRVLSGIQEVLAAELSRRGDVVAVMVEERHTSAVTCACW
jgi:hypothetical protein